jgi:hypothetical protein
MKFIRNSSLKLGFNRNINFQLRRPRNENINKNVFMNIYIKIYIKNELKTCLNLGLTLK